MNRLQKKAQEWRALAAINKRFNKRASHELTKAFCEGNVNAYSLCADALEKLAKTFPDYEQQKEER